MATAHKILRIVFAMLRDDKPYRDPQIDYQARTAIKNKARWLKMLRKANLLQEVAQQAAKQSASRAGRRPRRTTAGGRARAGSGVKSEAVGAALESSASEGVSTRPARSDHPHLHPADTSRIPNEQSRWAGTGEVRPRAAVGFRRKLNTDFGRSW